MIGYVVPMVTYLAEETTISCLPISLSIIVALADKEWLV